MSGSRLPHDDIRMRGFAARSKVEDAMSWVDEHASPRAGQPHSLDQCHGRVLAQDISAPIDVPSFARAAMDGYAVHAAETAGAGIYNPLTFRVVGQSLPGRGFEREISAGEAVRIMTGAPLPSGADAVIPVEVCKDLDNEVEVTESVAIGKHVGRIGEDIAGGCTILQAGRRLRPQDVGVLASLGIAEVPLVRQPRVRIIVTGNELVQPGQPRGAHQIYEANSFLLRGLVSRDGGLLESVRLVNDDREVIRKALVEPGVDVVLVSGGSSVGAEDHAPSLVAEVGELPIHGIAMRPSSPTGMGLIGQSIVFLLPGNPVSCLCAYDFFAGRAIRSLGGRSKDWPYPTSTESVVRKIVSAVGRVDYCRIRRESGGIVPLAISGASVLSSTTRADGFVIVQAESEGHGPGEQVTVYWYDSQAVSSR